MSSPGGHLDELAEQEQLLRSVTYLRDLGKVDIARLIGASEDVHFAPDTVIVREGAPADSLYLLGRGQVELSVSVTASNDRSGRSPHRPRSASSGCSSHIARPPSAR